MFPKLYQTLSRTVFDDMFRDLGEDVVTKRICEDLDDDSLLDSKLCVSLRVLLFFMHSKALLSRFFAAGICKSAVAALQRQRLSGSADYLEILWLRVNIVLTYVLEAHHDLKSEILNLYGNVQQARSSRKNSIASDVSLGC